LKLLHFNQKYKMPVRLPIDNLKTLWPQELKGTRLGAVLHPASVGSDFRHSSEILKSHEGRLFRLCCLFGPQHGILGQTQDNMIEWEGFTDPNLGVPVFSLYGTHREPTAEMMSYCDTLLVDLQDIGARYYTFIWTLLLCMRSASRYGKSVVVCDRPNPIGNQVEEGSPWDLDYSSFVGLHKIPIRHGKTIGALARQFRDELFPELHLYVLEMEDYNPTQWFDQTGLPWILPSPNMPTLETATVYPGMCLFEATNVSEGRGTTRPFELFGAPFIDSRAMCVYLNNQNLPGLFFREAHFQPTFHKYTGQICHGAQIHITNRYAVRSFEMAVKILQWLFSNHPADFQWRTDPYEYEFKKLAIDILLGNGWYRQKFIETSYGAF
jgi:uncharacterized protein YbbC (DUF1343 family)